MQKAESRVSDLFRKLAREQPGNIKILQRLLFESIVTPNLVCARACTHTPPHASGHVQMHRLHAHADFISFLIHMVTHRHSIPDIFCLSCSFELCPTLLSTEKSEKSH